MPSRFGMALLFIIRGSQRTVFSHFTGCLTCELLEFSREIVGVVEAAKKGDLSHGHIGGAKQLGCFLDADAVLIFLKALACEAFENIAKIVFVEVGDPREHIQ